LDDSLEAFATRSVLKIFIVSILVLLDDSLEAAWELQNPYILQVSILVLLDDSLEGIRETTPDEKLICFNPCSLG